MAEVDQPLVVGLHAELPVSLDLKLAARVLARRQLPWLGSLADSSAASRRAFCCDLRLPVSAAGRNVEFSKAAIVELGAVVRDGPDANDGGLRRAATLRRR